MGRQLKREEREGRVLGQKGEHFDGGWWGPIRFGQWGMCLKVWAVGHALKTGGLSLERGSPQSLRGQSMWQAADKPWRRALCSPGPKLHWGTQALGVRSLPGLHSQALPDSAAFESS